MEKSRLDKKMNFIDEYKKASNAATGSKYDSNANVTQKNLSTLQVELGKKDLIDINREITKRYLEKLYGKESVINFEKDLKHHIIYSHDESSILPYCASISLYPFLLNGLKDLGGSSNPPKHADSYIGGIINLVFLASSQLAGALAIPEFLTYFDHFLRVDYGQDYIKHLDDVLEAWGNRKATLKNKIEDLFQQFTYCINQPAGARNYQSPFINIAYFDKYYFESIFEDFVFPDGDEPNWETVKELQKMFMLWFNKERTKAELTFPVETTNHLVDKETREYKDKEQADFISCMWASGHSLFLYQSDSIDALSSCCRLRNEVEKEEFSYTLGAGGIKTGSKKVITLNLNRITQDWYRLNKERKEKLPLSSYIEEITNRVHQYLTAWAAKLQDDYDAGLLPLYKAGFIDLDKQFLTVGVNGFLEAAEFLKKVEEEDYKGIETDPFNEQYRKLSLDILGTIESLNKKHKTPTQKFNQEFVPAESAASKLYNWDKKDGYWVPSIRNLYNSYFYPVEDSNINPVSKFYYQGTGFADICSGGIALHNNLAEHLTKEQYRKLMDVAVKAGCNYFTYNIPNTVCNDCGHISKHYLHECPECGSSNVSFLTRVIGYLKRVDNFSEARQLEASHRFYGNLEK